MINGKKYWSLPFLNKHIQNVNLSTTTLSIERESSKMIELVKEKEKNIEKKNKPLQEKIAKGNERITELEKKEKENDQKIKEWDRKIKEFELIIKEKKKQLTEFQSMKKAIGGFTQFFINIFNFVNIFKRTSNGKK